MPASFTPGARVRLRRDAAPWLPRQLRRWALQARHATVERVTTAGVAVRFDAPRPPRRDSDLDAIVDAECLEPIPSAQERGRAAISASAGLGEPGIEFAVYGPQGGAE